MTKYWNDIPIPRDFERHEYEVTLHVDGIELLAFLDKLDVHGPNVLVYGVDYLGERDPKLTRLVKQIMGMDGPAVAL